MADKEEVSSVYGKPNFRLIVGLFAGSVVLILILGWVFLKFDPLKMRTGQGHRTGMILVLQPRLLTR